MPKSPLEVFFDKMFEAVEDAAEELVRDASKQAKENMRRMSRQLDQTTKGNQPGNRPGTLPRGQKRAQRPAKPVGRSERPSPVKASLYDVLEVSPKASPETISAAFRSLSTRFHPDTGKVKSESRYKEITAAWTVLKDPERRKKYDREIGI